MEHQQKPDLLSSLPLHLLLHIITFLPFESSRLTPFISTHFRSVWNQSLVLVPNLPIQHISHTISRFIRNFDPQDPSKNTRKLKLQVNNNKSFVFAILGPHNTMYISFSNGYNIQDQAANIFSWRLEINDQVPVISGLRVYDGFFVKTLCLEGVDSLTHDVVSSMVLEFSFLENLKICGCNGLTSFTIDSRTKLLNLSISNCSKLRYLDVKSLKLKTLDYKGFLPLIKIHEHFNLTKAIFDARQGPSYSSLEILQEFSPVLLIFKNTQSLTLCRWMFQELIKPSLSSSKTSFQFYKLQELRWIDNSMKQENIIFLISFLKLCPSIERLFITIDSNSYDSKEEVTIDVQASKHTGVLRSLKLVKFEGLKIDEEDKNQVILALKEIIDVDVDDKRFMLKDTRMKMV